jgi:hypothetical protein
VSVQVVAKGIMRELYCAQEKATVSIYYDECMLVLVLHRTVYRLVQVVAKGIMWVMYSAHE